MKSFLTLLRKETEEKLGRQLHENEMEFLQWLDERYNEEQQHINA
ncbi:hypothetical protein [Virgibacillus doumboii]|nr:hypothetical protein [Virgibacillus doumboii]